MPNSTPSPIIPPETKTPSPQSNIPMSRPTLSPEDLIYEYTDYPWAFSISIDASGGVGFTGANVGIGKMWKKGPHLFSSSGEVSPAPFGVSVGVEFSFSWDLDTLSDFEGDNYEVGLSIPYPIFPPVINGISMGVSFEPGVGILGIGKINGVSVSPMIGLEMGAYWERSWVTIINR